jgi:lipopolysaccharide transport system ATP-binding protein
MTAMLGFSRKEARQKFDEIVDFSELGEFIDAPVRTYSSGMAARLAFSVAVATDPDMLIIDEILSVGDMNFQKKCFDRVWSYKKRGKSMFFCSHGLYQVRQICDRAIWLRNGRVQLLADAVTVTNEYATHENNRLESGDASPFADATKAPAVEDHPRVIGTELLDPTSGNHRTLFSPGENAAIRVRVRNPRREKFTLAVGAKRTDGTLCFAHTTQFSGLTIDFADGYVTLLLDTLRLLSGEFGIAVWLLDETGVHIYQEVPAKDNLVVANRTKDLGLFLQDHRWVVEPVTA